MRPLRLHPAHAALLGLILSSSAIAGELGESACILGHGAHVRARPSARAKTIGRLRYGTSVQRQLPRLGWAHITVGTGPEQLAGYVKAELVAASCPRATEALQKATSSASATEALTWAERAHAADSTHADAAAFLVDRYRRAGLRDKAAAVQLTASGQAPVYIAACHERSAFLLARFTPPDRLEPLMPPIPEQAALAGWIGLLPWRHAVQEFVTILPGTPFPAPRVLATERLDDVGGFEKPARLELGRCETTGLYVSAPLQAVALESLTDASEPFIGRLKGTDLHAIQDRNDSQSCVEISRAPTPRTGERDCWPLRQDKEGGVSDPVGDFTWARFDAGRPFLLRLILLHDGGENGGSSADAHLKIFDETGKVLGTVRTHIHSSWGC